MDNGDRLNILLVDDQPGKLLSYETILAGLGENLIKATSARGALAHLLREDIAIVVMDVSMPDVDGFELAAMIRQHPRCQRTAIIFVSAVHLSDIDRLKGYETGAVDYLPVPIVPEMLRAKIRVLADLHRKTNQLTRWNAELEKRVDARTRELESSGARLRASEERFRSLAERMPHLVWESGPNASATYLSPRWYEYTGARPNEHLGQGWTGVIHPDDLEGVREAWRIATESGGALDYEARLRRNDGEYRWFKMTGEAVTLANGRVDKWVGTCTDIEERRRAEEGLREADRRKDEFLAMLAHELRNPLAPIRNTVKLLRLTGDGDATTEWGRDVIERQVEQLTRLVDDLLDVSRITRGKIRLQVEPIDLATVVAGAVETSRPVIDARRHALQVRLPSEPLFVMGDLVRLTQVVSNLLNNATKFQPDGGLITVEVETEGELAVIRVRDRGVGIPREMLGKVFELFAQVDRTVDRSEGGLGIGLSLAKNLVALHGGSIRATSGGHGRGSEFSVRLPILTRQLAAPDADARRAPAPRVAKALRILVVDDNRDAADSLSRLLNLRGYDTSVCHEGEAALELAQRIEPHVILLDLGLPGMDGFEVCRRLRDQGRDKAYIVAVTGYGQDEDRRRSREAGFDEHLVKPVDPDALIIRLEQVTNVPSS